MNEVMIVLPLGYYELNDTIDLTESPNSVSLVGLSANNNLADVIKAAAIGAFDYNILDDCASVKVAH